MAQIVDGTKHVTTQGQYMGEEGTGYSWGTLPSYGDISRQTHGRYQGYTEPCRIEILVEDARLAQSHGGEKLLFVTPDTFDKDGYVVDPVYGLDANMAIARGLARVVEE